jgi:hypothetical protein
VNKKTLESVRYDFDSEEFSESSAARLGERCSSTWLYQPSLSRRFSVGGGLWFGLAVAKKSTAASPSGRADIRGVKVVTIGGQKV